MAQVFGVSIDFLVNGNLETKAQNALTDDLLLKQFKEVEKMSPEDKNVVLKLIDAFITKKQLKQLAS